jgi:hypothetical protein
MTYRGPGFLAFVRFGSTPNPQSPTLREQVVSLSQSSCLSPVALSDGRGGGGDKSFDREDARSSVNHSILSGSQWQRFFSFYELCILLNYFLDRKTEVYKGFHIAKTKAPTGHNFVIICMPLWVKISRKKLQELVMCGWDCCNVYATLHP